LHAGIGVSACFIARVLLLTHRNSSNVMDFRIRGQALQGYQALAVIELQECASTT
jgi:hypothetical protein